MVRYLLVYFICQISVLVNGVTLYTQFSNIVFLDNGMFDLFVFLHQLFVFMVSAEDFVSNGILNRCVCYFCILHFPVFLRRFNHAIHMLVNAYVLLALSAVSERSQA